MTTRVFAALLLAATLLSAQGGSRFETLVSEFAKANNAWMQAMKAARSAGTPTAELPAPPTPEFATRFRTLSEENPGTEESGRALLWLFVNERSRDTEEQRKITAAHEALLDKLLSAHGDASFLEPLAQQCARMVSFRKEPNLRVLRALAEKNQSDAVRPWVLYGLGSVDANGATEATKASGRAQLKELCLKYPASEAAKAAMGTLFEAEHLGLGATPPDFETVDADGVAFKLSDYRGKVVVLDYWGFW